MEPTPDDQSSAAPPQRITPALESEPPDYDRPASVAPTESQLETETPGGSASRGHDPYAALRIADYRLYSMGWIISVIGHQMQNVAVGWEVYSRTGRELSLGWIGLVQALPIMILSLPAGQLADRFDRKRIVGWSSILAALSSIGLAIASWQQWHVGSIYTMLLIGSVGLALGWPARSALLPQVVPAECFNNAVTWNSSFFQLSAMIGPAIGGAVLHYAGARFAYVLDALCSLAFAASVLMLHLRPGARSKEPSSLRSLLAGVRFVSSTKIILATITLDLFAVLLGGATFLLPVFAQHILNVGEVGFGWLRASPAIGAFAAALLMAHMPPMRRAGLSLLWAVAGFGIATIIFGLSHSFWLSLLMLALTGAFDNVSVVVRHTLVQTLAPDAMRGRVAAVNTVFIGASNELGGFESGLTAQWWGPVASVVIGGAGTIAVVSAVALIWPQVRRLGSLNDLKALPMDEPVEEARGFDVIPAATAGGSK